MRIWANVCGNVCVFTILPSTWPHAGTDTRRLCDFPQELQVVGDREAHSCLASGICDDARSYDDRQTKACPLVSTGL